MIYNKIYRRKSSRSDSFLKSKGIQSVFHRALVTVQPFPAENLIEMAVKA